MFTHHQIFCLALTRQSFIMVRLIYLVDFLAVTILVSAASHSLYPSTRISETISITHTTETVRIPDSNKTHISLSCPVCPAPPPCPPREQYATLANAKVKCHAGSSAEQYLRHILTIWGSTIAILQFVQSVLQYYALPWEPMEDDLD